MTCKFCGTAPIIIIMKYSNPLFALLLLLPLISGYHRQRCAFGDSCWPSPEQWASFNSSISGRLIISLPSAAVCHREHYDAQLCQTATSNWTNSFWRTSQPGAYAAIVWELGQDQCFINTTIDAPCEPGLGRCDNLEVSLQKYANHLASKLPITLWQCRMLRISKQL